ncbi:glyoxalase [Paraburkholderia terricola]|uniref:Catechol 2,3-dioxygenase-like lactoylglutathione lyase family enzyme n=1 Tax=Paraburkholderia terricola TaxID=169427 RepID=A0ABU1M0J7_9BURK|nr:glyoxalase [Paraburkholderia terricola]MDR6412275.1 catechol 2,3-dioxygenase-like lactoylglutathione lyase family enzyme [Paraburkholderia terricola]MDR6484661.1 catechol 2,3-dioxygenase-like lactoylglutathione lyase family enzyme [Paraburkholderia terricola]
MRVIGIDHIQLAMPAGEEAAARRFYGGLLGMLEIPKPPHLARRGGLWFRCGSIHQVHLGVQDSFIPARKAHPGFLVDNLSDMTVKFRHSGVEMFTDNPIVGFERVFVFDPFGNRVELLEPR